MKNIFTNWVLLVLVVAVFAFWRPIIFSDTAPQTCAYFLNIGQGDATYIRTKNGKDILIDAGRDNKILSKLNKAMPFMDKEIDLAIATHLDSDHIGGMGEVLKNYQVNEVWWNGSQKDTTTFNNFKTELDAEESSGAKILVPEKTTTRFFGKTKVKVEYSVNTNIDENANSLVIKVTEGDKDLLMMGDLPAELEKNISIADIEVLHIGHHGSKTSTSDWLLDNFKPELAIISVGKNSYGHPHTVTIKKLSNRNIKIERTDVNGDIRECW